MRITPPWLFMAIACTAALAAAPLGDEGAPARATPVEGSHLVGARGRLVRDDSHASWRFRIQAADAEVTPIELILLPCALLESLERGVVRADDPAIELTGSVHVFRGRLYLRPLFAEILDEHAQRDEPEVIPASPVDVAPGTSAEEVAGDDDSIADIVRALEEAVGPLARSLPTLPSLPDDDDAMPAIDGMRLLSRRGRIVRAEGGGWEVVLDADASALADPPMMLLPCRTLEHLEQRARSLGPNPPIVISGVVLVYHGRRYLLPTAFRAERDLSFLES